MTSEKSAAECRPGFCYVRDTSGDRLANARDRPERRLHVAEALARELRILLLQLDAGAAPSLLHGNEARRARPEERIENESVGGAARNDTRTNERRQKDSEVRAPYGSVLISQTERRLRVPRPSFVASRMLAWS